MAYMSQERKKEMAPKIKELMKKYGVKGSIGVRHSSTLVVNIASGKLNFGQEENNGYIQVNEYHLDSHFTGEALDFLKELHDAMNVGNFDKSDLQSDYFHVGWYTDINVGKWNKPYMEAGETWFQCRPCTTNISQKELDRLDVLPICPNCGDDMYKVTQS